MTGAGRARSRGRRRAAGAPPLPDGAIVIDKPAGSSSYDVIRRLAPVLGRSKTGFVGTLDPFATGVLPLVIGEATKLVPFLLEESKEYVAELRLGVRTDTGDLTGSEVATASVSALDAATIDRAASRLTGTIEQIPPMYAAIRSGGERLYEKARRGEIVEREARPVTVHEFEILDHSTPDAITMRVVCSSGTYIRVLGEDLAHALGTEGHLSSLRRTRAGSFTVESAVSPDDVLAAGRAALVDRWLRPLDELASHLVAVEVTTEDLVRVTNGNAIPNHGALADGATVRLVSGGHLVAIARVEAEGVQPQRVFASPASPDGLAAAVAPRESS